MQSNSTKATSVANEQLLDLSDGIDTVKRNLLAVSNSVCAAEGNERVLSLADVSAMLSMLAVNVDQLDQQITAIRAQ